jgi:hypothetical protein
MNETPESIRQQMQETKAHLSEQLESLELQVSDTVQSTGAAVNSTLSAIEGAVHSVSNAFDLRRQIDRHPWLVLGGAVAVGYLAVTLWEGAAKKRQQIPNRPSLPSREANNAHQENAPPIVESTANAPAAARESTRENSSWHQLRDMAIGSVIAMVPEIASHVVPRIMDQLFDNREGVRADSSENNGKQGALAQKESSSIAAQRLQIAPPSNVRARKSF